MANDDKTRKFLVTGPEKGRLRAGMRFGPEPRLVELTSEQLAAISGDPFLKAEPAPAEAKTK